MNFSDEQLEIINAPSDEKTVVMAAAAAGKTATLTERIRTLLRRGIDPRKLVAITFTNNAAAEMRDRLGDDFKEGMFLGTIHSYANNLLVSKGFDTSEFREDEEFDKLFDLIAENPQVLREVDYLLCDESQDLNAEQFEFITTIIQPKAMLIVGDIRQSIYGFKGAEPKKLLNLMYSDEFEVRELTRNYRNGKAIIKFSNDIVDRMKEVNVAPVTAMRDVRGVIRKITPWEILSTVKTDKNWGNWAILCRTNKKVSDIMTMLKRQGIPNITFRQAQGGLNELKEKMQSNAVKVLTIHSAKGLEFEKVIVCDIYSKGEENMRLNYVAVTRARDELYLCF